MHKIELKKFNGDVEDYLSFGSQFQKIQEDKCISVSNKFRYLIQSVAPNSKASRVVESFPATSANYQQATHQINEGVGWEDLLVQVCIRDL